MNVNQAKAQTVVEYTMVLGIITVVLIAMQPMIKRAGQGMIKLMADQIGNQREGDQRAFYADSITDSYLEQAYTSTRSVIDVQTLEFLNLTNYVYDESIRTDSEQQSNLGFSPEATP